MVARIAISPPAVTMTNDRARNALAVWLTMFAFALAPVVYVLSSGPAIWLFVNGYLPEWAMIVYYPLAWLATVCAPIDRVLEAYTDLWQ
jgi:hypothetical protein